MQDVALVEADADARGGVGRPQQRYALAPEAPSLGLEPPLFPLATRLMLRLAAEAGATAEEALEIGRDQGRSDGRRATPPCLEAVVDRLATLGFDPAVVESELGATVAFTHCPFRDLAETHPELVCSLHRGLMEGFVKEVPGARVEAFRSLVDRDPCQMDLSVDLDVDGELGADADLGTLALAGLDDDVEGPNMGS